MSDSYVSPANAFKWMDVMRAAAAILVSASHLRDILWRDALPSDGIFWKILYFWTGFGHSGVIVFFVLSGFWITSSVMKRLDSRNFWKRYLIDRTSRLMIVLVPVLFIGIILDYIGFNILNSLNYTGLSGAHSLTTDVQKSFNIYSFLQSLFFLGGIVAPPFGTNGPLWSLSFEFWYYIWFPSIAFLIFKRKISYGLLSLLIGLFSINMFIGFISWLMGSALYFLVSGGKFNSLKIKRKLTLLSSSIFIIALFCSRFIHGIWFDPILACFFAIFLFSICLENLYFPASCNFVARFGSMSSFSLYALHFPFFMIIVAALTNGVRQDPSFILLMQSITAITALILFSIIFSRCTEGRTGALRNYLNGLLINNYAKNK